MPEFSSQLLSPCPFHFGATYRFTPPATAVETFSEEVTVTAQPPP